MCRRGYAPSSCEDVAQQWALRAIVDVDSVWPVAGLVRELVRRVEGSCNTLAIEKVFQDMTRASQSSFALLPHHAVAKVWPKNDSLNRGISMQSREDYTRLQITNISIPSHKTESGEDRSIDRELSTPDIKSEVNTDNDHVSTR